MTFSAKKLRVVVQTRPDLVDGLSVVPRSYDFVNMPIEVDIENAQIPNAGSAVIKIYGISQEKMDAITSVQLRTLWIKDQSVGVFADEGDGEHLIYCGNITKAVPCYDSAPDVYIRIDACTGSYWDTLGEVPPYSHKGMIPVHQAITEMCAAYGVICKNKGVLDMCENPYFDEKGLKKRLNAASQKYGIDIVTDTGVEDAITIYPRGIHIGKPWVFTSGQYIGYPSFNDCGIKIELDKLYFDLSLKDYFTIIGSEISVANGTWNIQKVGYHLSTRLGGNWKMELTGTLEI